MAPVEAAFYTVSDADYFVGTVALLNSLRLAGHTDHFFVADCGLTERQRQLLAPHATLVDASLHGVAHHAKLRAVMEHKADVMVLLDSDMLVLRRLDDLIRHSADGSIVAFADPLSDRFDPRWSELLRLGDLHRGTYVNTGALVIPRRLVDPILDRVTAAQEAVNVKQTRLGRATPSDPFYFVDQDVWNAVLASDVAANDLVVLPQRLAPHPPFKGLDLRSAGYTYADGEAPFLLHHVLAKPWLRRTRRNLYSRLLPRLLLEERVPVRLERRDLPLRLRGGRRAEFAQLGADVAAASAFFRGRLRGRLGIVPRLRALLSHEDSAAEPTHDPSTGPTRRV
jgi:hypothetical protein